VTVNGRSPAPYEVLKSRDALLEAAKLNRVALDLVGMDIESRSLVAHAAALSQVAQGLATYALAVDRWSP
jgi:hypothetical protein